MNEKQLEVIGNIRNAIDDLYNKLEVDLYEKKSATKVSYKKVRPADIVAENLEYIVENLNKFRDGEL